MNYRRLCIFILLLNVTFLFTQQTKPIEGIRNNTPRVHAIINAEIIRGPGRSIEKGTIVLRDGYIEAVGKDIASPQDARIWDYEGLTVYPGFLESYSQLGLPKAKKDSSQQEQGQTAIATLKKGATHWNPFVHPEDNVLTNFDPRDVDIKKLRRLGFTAALITPDKGIFCGSSALISLHNGFTNDHLIKNDVSQNILFKRPENNDERSYPNSLMGVIALIRQTFLDADWYQKAHQAYSVNPSAQTRPESNNALSALVDAINKKQSVAIRTADDLNTIRAAKVAREFGLNTWIVGSGHEYRQIETIKQMQIQLVIPINFPEAPDIESPEAAINVSLLDLSHWDAASRNPKRLYQANIPFAITSSFLKKPEDFYKNLKRSIALGLPENAALSALTTTPAKIMGVADLLGTIDVGKLGHLVVTNGNLFSEKTKIQTVWVDGRPYEFEKMNEPDPRGKWSMVLELPSGGFLSAELELKGELKKLIGNITHNSDTVKLTKASIDLERINLVFPGNSLGFSGVIRLSGLINDMRLAGKGELPDGSSIKWTADLQKTQPAEKSVKDNLAVIESDGEDLIFPLGAYTYTQIPEQPKHVLVKNATIWTSGPDGILENADLLITDGKINKIGKGLKVPKNAIVIDASDKHVTPGLIDEHSHTGISQGINEGTQAVTAEVRIKDVINNRDIAFYRELAGGLTVVNQFHGSSNPIGGQSSTVKIRWGASPEDFQIREAKPGIKFALGENVKRSNWGSEGTTRYPQTRMGVEQIIRDRFKAALDYEKEWTKYRSFKKKEGIISPRRDLELETILEILKGDRDVHCHAYRQDEMLMLIRIAEDFGFTIGTFEHALEGYKIADIIASHGAGASVFSDWWAYKFEVYDAIPYAGALMHDVGVVVAFNSDDNELARRMNFEAAKAVKYGSVTEEEALKFVTLNPAKQLKIDHLVGSLEKGKDGDFVIWSGHPFSTYTKCEQTWIDGRKYFDIDKDRLMQEQVKTERVRLIQKILTAKKNKTTD